MQLPAARSSWKIKEPQTITLGGVRSVRTRLYAGSLNIVGTDSEPRLEVLSVKGRLLQIRLSDRGELFIGYDEDDDRPGRLRRHVR